MNAHPKDLLHEILGAALNAVAPDKAVGRFVSLDGDTLLIDDVTYYLNTFENIYVVGAGKGAAPMAAKLEEILGDKITDGVICVKYDHTVPLRIIRTIEGAHPVPDANGERGARAILDLATKAGKKDLVLCCITGGASALTPALVDGISLDEGKQVTQLLLDCGATINEINAIRKHMSIFGSGNLARAAYPAPLAALIISDVVGDSLDVIASGPTSPDNSTFKDCMDIFERYKLIDKVPVNILAHMEKGIEGVIYETPKVGDPVFDSVQNLLVATNKQALEAAAVKAKKLGYTPRIVTSTMTGEARTVAKEIAQKAQNVISSKKGKLCLLSGGETTVTLTGKGVGGRNQEMALAAAVALDGCPNIAMLCAGTDGSDGPTDAAGGFALPDSLTRAKECRIDPQVYLADNDSYNYLRNTGDLLQTGPTLTNVMDICITLVQHEPF
ncbi:glycerate kinase type-2 family protein [Halodesulfovibrio marinisediminis]|uniref:Glycerate 2-kinase n=1 Tax=Halodesulfovibrio marinisediminis DSM 17456 TaxID=1121457 RepID=A0A1N6G098_9BACT|nr:glycerate kinase [Halodesulfovibrio marinisediminis]SIO00890.1 glycerate 2-kinase [Halodesulfovibrio marinisediminis DSM 17456]